MELDNGPIVTLEEQNKDSLIDIWWAKHSIRDFNELY